MTASLSNWNIPFRNDSGEEVPPFAVLRVTGLTTIGGRTVVTIGKPNTYGSQYSHFVNGPITVPADGYGTCTNDFPAMVSANGTATVGQLWGPRSGSWELESSTPGFIALGDGVFNRDPFVSFYGKFDSTVAQGNTGTVSIWYGAGSGTDGSDTTINMSSVLAVGNSFTTSDFVNCYRMNGTWEAYARKC